MGFVAEAGSEVMYPLVTETLLVSKAGGGKGGLRVGFLRIS